MKWTGLHAKNLRWSAPITNEAAKRALADHLARFVKDGDTVGVGSGSTAFLAIQAIGRRVAVEGIRLTAIPTSTEAALTCAMVGIPTSSLLGSRPDWGFDGADEVDPAHNMIKGRGGALLAEKILMRVSPVTHIIVDESKLVDRLGLRFPVPVEICPLALHLVQEALLSLGAATADLRLGLRKDGPVITEHGNFLLDATFAHIDDGLEREIKGITGVVESGLFQGYSVRLITPQATAAPSVGER